MHVCGCTPSQVGHRHLFHCPVLSPSILHLLDRVSHWTWSRMLATNPSNILVPHPSLVLGFHVFMAIPSFFCGTIEFELRSSWFFKQVLLPAEPHPLSCLRNYRTAEWEDCFQVFLYSFNLPLRIWIEKVFLVEFPWRTLTPHVSCLGIATTRTSLQRLRDWRGANGAG